MAGERQSVKDLKTGVWKLIPSHKAKSPDATHRGLDADQALPVHLRKSIAKKI